jgi:hypothetical protein
MFQDLYVVISHGILKTHQMIRGRNQFFVTVMLEKMKAQVRATASGKGMMVDSMA